MKSILIQAHSGLITFRFQNDENHEYLEWERRKYPKDLLRRDRAFDFYEEVGAWHQIVVSGNTQAKWHYFKGLPSISSGGRYIILPDSLIADLPKYLSKEIRWAIQSELLPLDLTEWKGSYFLFTDSNGRQAVKHNGTIIRHPEPEEDRDEWRRSSDERDAKKKRERKRKFKIRKAKKAEIEEQEDFRDDEVEPRAKKPKSLWQKVFGR